jgi:hypothetical protein
MADLAERPKAPTDLSQQANAAHQPAIVDHLYAATVDDVEAGDGAKLERHLTNSAVQDIPHPGDVRINVQGAFIVDADDEPTTPGEGGGSDFEEDGYLHDPKDIRLPNHTAIVSHIAVDVRIPSPSHSREEKTDRVPNCLRLAAPLLNSCISLTNLVTSNSVVVLIF